MHSYLRLVMCESGLESLPESDFHFFFKLMIPIPEFYSSKNRITTSLADHLMHLQGRCGQPYEGQDGSEHRHRGRQQHRLRRPRLRSSHGAPRSQLHRRLLHPALPRQLRNGCAKQVRIGVCLASGRFVYLSFETSFFWTSGESLAYVQGIHTI